MSTDRNLSTMIDAVRAETAAVNGMTDRMREANRRLTGGTGQAPTQLSTAIGSKGSAEASGPPPLMIGLNIEIDGLQAAVTDLRNELTYLENHSETGAPMAAERGLPAGTGTASKGW